jgi:hypothetical protein
VAAALRAVAPGPSAALASELRTAMDGRPWSDALAASVVQTLGSLTAAPSRFIELEDELVRALTEARADAAGIERVLAALEDLFMARWR